VKIFEAKPQPARNPKGIAGKMGEIVAIDGDGICVVCADGRFKVSRVQADGPKIAANEFATNAKLNTGMRFS
jgi:methionyl-tRNA formyltransferase